MKTLLKSKDQTQTIINAIRYYRQQFIEGIKTVKATEGITSDNLNVAIKIHEQSIDECNAVLDAIGTD